MRRAVLYSLLNTFRQQLPIFRLKYCWCRVRRAIIRRILTDFERFWIFWLNFIVQTMAEKPMLPPATYSVCLLSLKCDFLEMKHLNSENARKFGSCKEIWREGGGHRRSAEFGGIFRLRLGMRLRLGLRLRLRLVNEFQWTFPDFWWNF